MASSYRPTATRKDLEAAKGFCPSLRFGRCAVFKPSERTAPRRGTRRGHRSEGDLPSRQLPVRPFANVRYANTHALSSIVAAV